MVLLVEDAVCGMLGAVLLLVGELFAVQTVVAGFVLVVDLLGQQELVQLDPVLPFVVKGVIVDLGPWELFPFQLAPVVLALDLEKIIRLLKKI